MKIQVNFYFTIFWNTRGRSVRNEISGTAIFKWRYNDSISKNLRGSNLSAHAFTSPCLHDVPAPHRSFTRMLSRTGLEIKCTKHQFTAKSKSFLVYDTEIIKITRGYGHYYTNWNLTVNSFLSRFVFDFIWNCSFILFIEYFFHNLMNNERQNK